MIVIAAILCIIFYLLLWTAPVFKKKTITSFDRAEQFLLKRGNLIRYIVLAIYLCITLLLQLNHPVDGDEAQAWLIARDTPTLNNMYSLMGYEGSPALWHTLLRPFAKSGIPFFSIYIINHFFIISAVIVWLWFAPFPLLLRILLPLTPLFLTEYAINARSYALSTFLLFSALAVYNGKYSKWPLWSFLFFLLANTNIHSTILCCGFTLFLLLNWLQNKKATDLKAAILIGSGIIIAIIQVLPPPDLQKELAIIGLQYSIPKITASIFPGFNLLSTIGYFLLLANIIYSIASKKTRTSLIATQLVFFVFFLFKYPGEMRHHFFLFLSIILSLWISDQREKYKVQNWSFLIGALCLMVLASIPIIVRKTQPGIDHKKETSNFIKKIIIPDSTIFIASQPDNLALTLIPYLPIRQVYYPETEQWGSYIIWNQKRKSNLFDHTNTANIKALVKNNPGFRDYYYLTTIKIPADSAIKHDIVQLKQSTDNRLLQSSHPWNTIYCYKLAGNK